MNASGEVSSTVWLAPVLLAAFSVSGWFSISILRRWLRGEPVVAYAPRRRVPWHGGDVLAVLIVYVALITQAIFAVRWWLGPDLVRPLADAGPTDEAHPIVRLIAGGNAWMLVAAVATAVIVAPLVEEFLFRVLLLGYLEDAWRRWRRAAPALRRLGPAALAPVVVVSLLFAWLHVRSHATHYTPQYEAGMLFGQEAAAVLTVLFAIVLLRCRAGADAADFGWSPQHLAADVRLGFTAFCAMATPLYLLQFALQWLLPKGVAPDPAPIFLLALALGTLYHRTHRIAPSLAMHVSLNATSMLLLLLTGLN